MGRIVDSLLLSGFSVCSANVEEASLDGRHLVISCILVDGNKKIATHALVDSVATGFAFVDEDFVRHHNLPLTRLETPREIEVIDGRPIESGSVTHLTGVRCNISSHSELLPMFVTRLGHYPIVLGIPWLKHHDADISWSPNSVSFNSDVCLHTCLDQATTIKGISIDRMGRTNISLITASALSTLTHRPDLVDVIAPLTVYEIDQALKDPAPATPDLATLVPAPYHDFLPLFQKSLADKLPPHRPYDHVIPLKEGFTPPFGPLYSLSHNELKALREWLDDNLSKGFIRASSSPAGAPILFVKKKDGSLRLCVDYRGINEGTIKNRYPLPLIKETLNQLSRARIYTTLDIRGAYNLVRMAEGDEWKTAFRTRYGLFESLVMPFGLTNAPATFQHFINDVLRPYLDQFCTAYLDDILIYSDNLEDHVKHVRLVLKALSAVGLHLKPEKCEFHRSKVNYLGLVISSDGVSMDPRKVETITN